MSASLSAQLRVFLILRHVLWVNAVGLCRYLLLHVPAPQLQDTRHHNFALASIRTCSANATTIQTLGVEY
jgi:hypothetical protein